MPRDAKRRRVEPELSLEDFRVIIPKWEPIIYPDIYVAAYTIGHIDSTSQDAVSEKLLQLIEIFALNAARQFHQDNLCVDVELYRRKDADFHLYVYGIEPLFLALFDDQDARGKFALRYVYIAPFCNRFLRKDGKFIKDLVTKINQVDQLSVTEEQLRATFVNMPSSQTLPKVSLYRGKFKGEEFSHYFAELLMKDFSQSSLTAVCQREQDANGRLPFVCVSALSDNMPQPLREAAANHAVNLQQEEGYDNLMFSIDATRGYDIFFVFTPGMKICVGSFVVKLSGRLQTLMAQVKGLYGKFLIDYKERITDPDTGTLFTLDAQVAILSGLIAQVNERITGFETQNTYSLSMQKYMKEPPWLKVAKLQRARLVPTLFYLQVSPQRWAKASNAGLVSAWIHPVYRRQGVFTEIWAHMAEKYGVMFIDRPSKKMRALLKQEAVTLDLGADQLAARRASL